MNIKLEQKKKYVAPEMELVEMKSSRAMLLEDSCTDPDKCNEVCGEDEVCIPIKN